MKKLIFGYPRKFVLFLMILFYGVYTFATTYFVRTVNLFNGVENTLRYLVMSFFLLLWLIFSLWLINVIASRKFKRAVKIMMIFIFVSILLIVPTYLVKKAYSKVETINKTYIDYSTSLVVLNSSNLKKIGDVKNKKIGIIDDENSIDGYILANEIVSKHKLDDNNTLVDYSDFVFMLNDLYDGKIDAMFIATNYPNMFTAIEKYEHIEEETTIITSKTKRTEKTEDNSIAKSTALLDKPFTILVLGVDSTLDDINGVTAFNGDAIMLITFNPNTLNATMLSIPRDTYVPISCFRGNIENKITHAAWYGESCMIKTIQNFTGMTIDHYVKINFKGVVKMVDALGGIDVDVPIDFCEQDSNRMWGNNEICLNKGYQHLTGEQALALSRHRKTINDMQRGLHQQLVIGGILNKLKTVKSINTVYSVLDAVNKTMDTSLSMNQILSLYNVAKDIIEKSSHHEGDFINIQQLYLSGYGKMIWDQGMGLTLYNYIYYRGSLKDCVRAMKINLGLENEEYIKSFSYNINNLYEVNVIGTGYYSGEKTIDTVPDFTWQNISNVKSWCSARGITLNINYFESSHKDDVEGSVISQSVPANYKTSDITSKEMTVTVVKKIAVTPPPEEIVDCAETINDTKDVCKLPDFTGKTLSNFNTWASKLSKYNVNIIISRTELDEADPLFATTDEGKVAKQNKSSGTLLRELAELTVHYKSTSSSGG